MNYLTEREGQMAAVIPIMTIMMKIGPVDGDKEGKRKEGKRKKIEGMPEERKKAITTTSQPGPKDCT